MEITAQFSSGYMRRSLRSFLFPSRLWLATNGVSSDSYSFSCSGLNSSHKEHGQFPTFNEISDVSVFLSLILRAGIGKSFQGKRPRKVSRLGRS